MLKVKRDKCYIFLRYTVMVVVFCCMLIIGNSSLGKSQSESRICAYEGSYKFIHSKRVSEHSRCKFSNGARVSHDSGYAILEPEEKGFSFAGGEGARWYVQASCENPKAPTVTIRLENHDCKQEVVSSSESSFELGPEGEISIKPYSITWTCGERSWSCDMIEAWELVPELW
jgi:hypothetical protein